MVTKRPEALAPVDNTWLRMDDSTNLMMITGVFLFDTAIDIERLKMAIVQRMLRFDRFRQRIVDRNGASYWELDPNFDVRNHIRRIGLPSPGDQSALQDLVSDLMSTPLDPNRPLWQFHIVERGAAGSMMVCRLHHSIADGVALVQVLLSLTADSKDGSLSDIAEQSAPLADRTLVQTLGAPLRTVAGMTLWAAERILTLGLEAIAHSPRATVDVSKPMAATAALSRLSLMPADAPTVLKGPLGVVKRAAWSQHIDLQLVKSVGKTMGGTINDVLLTAVTGALRRYLIGRGEDVEGLQIRAVIPVNLRSDAEADKLGNRFGLVFLSLPVGTAIPFERLLILKDRMEALKQSAEAGVVYGLLNAVGTMPQIMQDQVVELFGSKATVIMTNVPGPRSPRYLAGAKIEDIMFWVPQSGRLGLGVSILSYAGRVLVGIAGDAGIAPDPEQIVAEFHHEFDDMVEQVRRYEHAGLLTDPLAATNGSAARKAHESPTQ